MFVRNFCILKNKYDFALWQSRLHTASETFIVKFGSGSIFSVFASVAFILIGKDEEYGKTERRLRKFRTQYAMPLRKWSWPFRSKLLRMVPWFSCQSFGYNIHSVQYVCALWHAEDHFYFSEAFNGKSIISFSTIPNHEMLPKASIQDHWSKKEVFPHGLFCCDLNSSVYLCKRQQL